MFAVRVCLAIIRLGSIQGGILCYLYIRNVIGYSTVYRSHFDHSVRQLTLICHYRSFLCEYV